MAAPAVAAAAAPAVAAAAPAVVNGAAGAGIAAGAAELLREFVAGLLGAGVVNAMNPPAIPSAGTDASGKYFIGPETDLRLIPDYQARLLQNRIFNALGFNLPEPRTPEEITGGIEARQIRMAQDLTEREIQKLRESKAYDLAAAQLLRDAEIQRAALDAVSSLRRQEVQSAGDVRGRELESLGRTQAERLRSSYGMASDVLQNAIQNVLQSGVINDRTAQVELAKIQ